MSRKTPVPVVDISANIFEDEETGENSASIIIDVKISDDTSCGFVVLDDPGDLYILKNAIDDYIARNHILNPSL